MAQLRVADEDLLRALYAEHGGFLLSYARRLLRGDESRAEDVVQETLLRAWRHPEAFTDSAGGSVRGWLVTVARNVVIDGERARASRPTEVPADGTDTAAGRDVLDAVLVAHEVSDALQAISAEHRAVVHALYAEDMSVAQAAAALGIPEGTVKSRAYYGLRALRAACEERGVRP
jgi:RNA polymerase sigma-70 factor (ECF subfamily)